MKILGIETSCDETGAAVLEDNGDGVIILSNIVASSAELQAKYGGVIPEQAAREQIKSIIPVIEEALTQAFPNSDLRHQISEIDATAVTAGPGLIGSLLVGVETAKTLSWIWHKPLIPVNHLIGHFYANWINPNPSLRTTVKQSQKQIASSSKAPRNDAFVVPEFPCLGLLVSGGHTDIVLFTGHGQYKYLGGTRDDASGECFDKCARLLGLPYPGGPQISKLAQEGNLQAFKLPRPMIDSDDLDFSFSGLKTAVSNLITQLPDSNSQLPDLCASIEAAITECLVNKTIKAIQITGVEHLIVAGGVAANQKLISELQLAITNKQLPIKLHVPPPQLCTDNAAMIAAAAFFQKEKISFKALQADPNLSLSY